MYLHHLLTSDECLASEILHSQIRHPMKHDWILSIERDLKELEIQLTFSEIAQMSKNVFKKYLKTKCHNFNFQFMMNEKPKSSKGILLTFETLQVQNYLRSASGLSVHMMRNIFQTRIRDLPLKCNFKNAHKDFKCLVPQCQGQDETKHVFECQYLSSENELSQNLIAFEDIYGSDVKKQFVVMNILKTRLQKRRTFIAPENMKRGPGGPRKGKRFNLVTREAKQKKYHKQIQNKNI